MSASGIRSFLRAARRRLWLESCLRQLRLASWIAALLLLTAGIVRLFLPAIDTGLALLAAASAALLAMLPTLLRPPHLDVAARRADRCFDGYSLLTTAWLHERNPARGASAALLLERAAQAAVSWRPRLHELWQAPPASGFALALAPAFLGLMLLHRGVDMPSYADTSSPAADQALAAVAESGVAELRRALQQDNATIVPAEQHNAAGGDPVLTGEPVVADAPLPDSASSGLQSVAADGQRAGDAARDTNAPAIDLHANATRLQFDAIERRGNRAAAGDSGGRFTSHPAAAAAASTAVAAATPPAAPRSRLTAAELDHARRYLDDNGH